MTDFIKSIRCTECGGTGEDPHEKDQQCLSCVDIEHAEWQADQAMDKFKEGEE